MLKNILSNLALKNRPKRYESVGIVPYRLQRHQEIVRNHMKTHKRLLIVHGTGSGKTLSAAYIAKDYLDKGTDKNVIFVTPKAVQDQFIKSVTTVISNKPGFYFTTYDNLTIFLNEFQLARRESFKRIMANTMIIADEAHYVTEKTQKARIFYDIFMYADKVVLMTGTPIINGKTSDLLPYAKILNPTKASTLKASDMVDFEQYFKCKISIYDVPQGSSNFPILHPTERINFPITNNQISLVEANRYKKYAGKGTWAFNRGLYAWRVFGNQDEPKFTKFLEIFRSRPHKTIVFFKEYVTLETFAKFLKKHNIFFRRVTGKDPRKNLIISKDGPRKRVVYLLTSAAKEGLDFKGVRTVIFMDYPWVPSDYNQIIGRARRFQSHMSLNTGERNVKVYELAYSHPSKKTLNMRSLNILNSKRQLIRSMIERLSRVSIENPMCSRVYSPKTPVYRPQGVRSGAAPPAKPQLTGNMGLARLFRETTTRPVAKRPKPYIPKRSEFKGLFHVSVGAKRKRRVHRV